MEPTPPVAGLGGNDETALNESSASPRNGSNELLDPRLDFLSEEFDPVKVLQISPSKVHLPHPSIHPCDNLQIYQSVVQGTSRYAGRVNQTQQNGDEDPVPDDVGVAPDDGSKDVTDLQMGGAADGASKTDARQAQKPIRTVIDFMQTRSRTGPFSVLHQSWVEGKRVRVLTRHCAGVRGVCTGRLIAFDHHMNLVLGDVEEWWAPFRTVSNGGITLSKNQRRRRNKQKAVTSELAGKCTDDEEETTEEGVFKEGCWQNCGGKGKWERYQFVKQLYMRGDNIILISNVT